ncbi:MAG TPA: CPBP family intramembrane glutamic endopeptidase [Parasulfuritortus sp.]
MSRAPSPLPLPVEFTLVFIGLPLLGWWQSDILKRWIIPLILFFTFLCIAMLAKDREFRFRTLRSTDLIGRPRLKPLALRFVLAVALTLWWFAVSGHGDFLRLPREQTGLWLAVLILYPLVSALPQELLFRVCFFQRYRELFLTERRLIFASAFVFGLAHLILDNWQAPVIAFIGGLLFAWTYARTQSLLLVALEHGLWGDWIFTLGLGKYFYGGHY